MQKWASDSSHNELVHITANMIHNYYTKGKFCLPYSAYTRVSLILKCTDMLHEGDVDPKGSFGFEPAAQKSSTVEANISVPCKLKSQGC